MKKQLSIWFQFVVCVAVGATAYGAWQEQDTLRGWLGFAATGKSNERNRSRAGVPVIVSEVGRATDNLTFETVGTGLAEQSVVLRAEVAGTVSETFLVPGQRFSKGDVLLRLDDPEQQLALRLAETRLKDAERNRDRLERLRKSGAVAASVYEDTITAAELAGLELERAREALMDRVVRAPFDGVAGLPSVEPGDRVEAGAELATFDDRRTLFVEFDLPETILARLDTKSKVEATTPIAPGRVLKGRVALIDSRVDPTTRAARIRVAIPNEDDFLRPGASFTITLELPGEDYPVVPELALQFSSGALYVWRVVDGKARQVEVKLIRRRAGEVLVDGTLARGDQVVVEGTQRLAPDRPVEIIGDAASTGVSSGGPKIES
jgi:RND family efflux transporter MFP subunit